MKITSQCPHCYDCKHKKLRQKNRIFFIGSYIHTHQEASNFQNVRYSLRDIASLRINLSLNTVQLSPPMFGQFCE